MMAGRRRWGQPIVADAPQVRERFFTERSCKTAIAGKLRIDIGAGSLAAPWPSMFSLRLALSAAGLSVALGCTAVSVSPPLSPQAADSEAPRPGEVLLTSGSFNREVEVMGVMQMTQSGYRWFYEVEVVTDANPASILFKVAQYARAHGADGVQRLELVDLKPQSDGERTAKQVQGVMRVADAAKRGQGMSQAAKEGEKTRWEVRREFVKFVTIGGPS